MYHEFYDKKATDTRSEDAHQVDSIAWLRYRFPTWIVFHVNNEGKKGIGQSVKDQMKGLLKGVPDILIIPDRSQCKYGFIAIELKRAKKSLSHVSDEQKQFIDRVNENGGFGALCYGVEQVKAAIEEALK